MYNTAHAVPISNGKSLMIGLVESKKISNLILECKMAEQNKIKIHNNPVDQILCENFILSCKEITCNSLYSYILKIAVLRKLETKPPSWFLLMKNYFKKFVEAYHKKKFQVKDGEYDSIIFPDRYLLEAISNYHTVTRGLFRSILESIHKALFIIERLILIDLIIGNGVW